VLSDFHKAILILLSCFSIPSAFGACHVVTPTGSGSRSGADWNNAYAGVPATLTRGDLYYLADGSYSSYTFNTAASGATVTEIRKAQSSDHCTDTGWNTSTMGNAQAIFPAFTINASYFILNGNGSQTAPGCGSAPGSTVTASPSNPKDCGIKIAATGNVGLGISGNAGQYTVRYLEEVGTGVNNGALAEFYGGSGGSVSTFSHIYAHNAGCVFFQYGGDQRQVSFSYFWGTETDGAPTGSCHGQYSFYAGNDSNSSEHDNVYRDITGTAVWTFAWSPGTHTNWTYYNNVIFQSSPAVAWKPYLSDGILACINSGVNCNNFGLYQNTVVNISGNSGINNENTGTYIVQNNLWYGGPGGTPGFNKGNGGTYTQDHNSFLQEGSSCPSGTANVCSGSSSNPFVGWPGIDFNITSENANWTNRLSLASPYTTDPSGVTRITDRGAYQYSLAQGPQGPQGPQPATALSATVNIF